MIEIPARHGKAARLRKGQVVKVINTTGQQVVDTWAFNAEDLREFMSMEHSRVAIGRIIPAVGDTLVTNVRRPILTIVEDTSGGIHDTLFAACDRWRYELLGCAEYHDNCTDNLAAGLAELGLVAAGNAGAAQPLHEHPGCRRQSGRGPAAGQHAGQLCGPARRDGLRRRFLGLSAGYAAGQWLGDAADACAFRDRRRDPDEIAVQVTESTKKIRSDRIRGR